MRESVHVGKIVQAGCQHWRQPGYVNDDSFLRDQRSLISTVPIASW
jgi:hypothetical protein